MQPEFVLICATTSNFYAICDILDIIESVTYVFPICPTVGAPALAFETWETTELRGCGISRAEGAVLAAGNYSNLSPVWTVANS